MKNFGDAESILQRLTSILPVDDRPLALHAPCFQGNEWAYVKDCLDTGWVSSAGEYVQSFEKKLAEYTGMQHVVAVVNGTAALYLALLILGIKADDEVLVPALTFVATANAISYCGAIPHFVDSELSNLGIDAYKLDTYLEGIAEMRSDICYNRVNGHRIKAVVPMHTFGQPVDMDPLLAVCEKYHLDLIEDAAEALGTFYKGQHMGHWGRLSILSFNGNKIVTCGGGGAILSQDKDLAEQARHLSTQAKLPHPWLFQHDMIGYNYRLPNLNAALGCAQLEELPAFLTAKRNLAEYYQQSLQDLSVCTVYHEASFACSNYWLNILLLDDKIASVRDRLLTMAHKQGIMLRPAWNLLCHLPIYQNCPRMDLSQAESLVGRIINLPSSVELARKLIQSGSVS